MAVSNQMPKDIQSDIMRYIGDTEVLGDQIAIIYKYLTATHPDLALEDIKAALEGKPIAVIVDEAMSYFMRNPDPVKTHVKFLENNLGILGEQAQETGNWTHYLKTAQEKAKYENSDTTPE